MLKIDNLAVIDIETSGPNPFIHDILSIAIVPIDNSIETLSLFVRNKDVEWTEYSKNLFRRYSEQWRLHAVEPHIACDRVEDYLGNKFPNKDVTPIGHNIGFDVAFIRKLAYLGGRTELRGLSHRVIDTHTMLYILYLKGLISYKALSSDGAFYHFDIVVPDENRHTALGDALATRELFISLAKKHGVQVDSDGIPTVEDKDIFITSLTKP